MCYVSLRDEDGENVMTGAKRILLVEDDAELCDATSIGLNRRGYEVSAFVDSQAARAAFEHDPASWDLVITDQNMPGLTGSELTRIVKQHRRDLPVILWSSVSPGSAVEADKVLCKPVEDCVLLQTMRGLLDRAGPARA
jgi:DNA-binding response OmpR family regulator